MNELQDLTALIRANTPLIVIETQDEGRVVDLFRQALGQVWRALFRWSITEGLRRLDMDREDDAVGPPDASAALQAIKQAEQRGIYLLFDFHPYLGYASSQRQLRDILQRRHTLLHVVVLVGADSGRVETGGVEPFARALSAADARDPDVLLAWEMNGEPLTPDHGFPLHAVVPGRYAVDSVKWLAEIRLQEEPFRGFFQEEHYRFRGEAAQLNGLHDIGAFAARELEILVQHPLHLREIGLHRFGVGILRHHRKLKPHACQRRLQVVADAREHIGALLHEAVDPFAHLDERGGGLAHFGRTARLEVGDRSPLAERFRRRREPLDRSDLVAQEQHRDRDQHKR